jgi:hypothetical protein
VKPTVQVGNQTVPLKDFIAAVLANTENNQIDFSITDGRYQAKIRFTTKRS